MMEIKWSITALQNLDQIKSQHFTPEETAQYKKQLVKKIERKVANLMETMPAREPEFHGTYRAFVDRYKVYYSFSDDKRICYIEAFKHQHQK